MMEDPVLATMRAKLQALQEAITQYETFLGDGEKTVREARSLAAGPIRKRGRKGMGAEERKKVSARMKDYWETRRRKARAAS